jgi:MFS family permease
VHETAQVLAYALVAAASPVVLLATLAILGSGRGRVNGTVFMAGFVLGQSIAFLVALLVGGTIGDHSRGDDAVAYFELAAGLVLLGIAWRQRAPRSPRAPDSSRTEALVARLARITPAVTFGIGLPLGIGTKRLVLTVLAAVSVARSDLIPAEQVALGFLFVLVATVVVWVPVTLYLIFGKRSDDLVVRCRASIAAHEQPLAVVSLVVLGVLFIVDGVVRLLS